MTLLKVTDFRVAYGGIKAVKGVDLDIHQGEIVTLIGSNGAGKTTLLKAICGLLRFEGQMTFAGVEAKDKRCDQLVKLGLSLVPEGRGVFSRLTVSENLMMGAYLIKDKTSIKNDIDRIYQMFPRLSERKNQIAGTLSGGEQQMLAIGRAMMARPKMLLLDEPSMGLAPMMVEKIFQVIDEISNSNVTILLVEQNANLALNFAARAYVMDSGRITLKGPSSELKTDSSVRQAYLGG